MLRSACIATVISVNAARILRTPTFLYRCATAAANIAAVFQLSQSLATAANPPLGPADTYFGVGCFWHVQHEFVEAETFILHRDIRDITVRMRLYNRFGTVDHTPLLLLTLPLASAEYSRLRWRRRHGRRGVLSQHKRRQRLREARV
jgi:hypothetical protein